MSAIFRFEGARVAVLPALGFVMVRGTEMAYNTAVLEVKAPARRDGSCDSSLVEVEAWGQVARELSGLHVGDVVSAEGVVSGKPYMSRRGEQRYLTVLRLRRVVVARRGELPRMEQDDLGF